MRVGDAMKQVTAEWRALRNEDKQKFKNLAQNGRNCCHSHLLVDMARFQKEVKGI